MAHRLGLRRPTPVSPSTTDSAASATAENEQDARAEAYDSAQAWAQAMAQVDQRLAMWCERMAAARDAGSPPAVLLSHIRAVIDRLGIEPEDVPSEVWQAAGISIPDGP